MKKFVVSTISLMSFVSWSGVAYAEGYYISLSGGVSMLSDSQNEGSFIGDFTTGEGTAVPAGAVLPGGTSVGWDTSFDTGYSISGAIGRKYNFFRGEMEVAYQTNGVESHSNVVAGGIDLDTEDAGVLITGSSNIGTSVGVLVDDGQGDVSTVFVMANIFYDVDLGGRIKPYIGGGVGAGFVDVDYYPSGVVIIQDNSTAFAYQAMAGVAYAVAPSVDLILGYRYRATSDVNVSADLFSADFDVENSASVVEAGLRFTF